jgi:RNA-directed DNA polymerase
LATLHVTLNEDKSRMVDLAKGESFGFLGFEFRRMRSRKGIWRPHYAPQMTKRTALLRRLKTIFRDSRSQPIDRVIYQINPILRGWVNYFAIGHASRCFSYVQNWVEKKIRRHLMRARQREGFGWKRWSRPWLYQNLGLFGNYRVSRPKQLRLKVLPVR